MEYRLFGGLDPGKKGCYSTFRLEPYGVIRLVDVIDFAQPGWIARLDRALRLPNLERVWKEKVHSMPRQGVKSTFTFGKSDGQAEAIVELTGCRVEVIRPSVWQYRIGMGRVPGATKAARRRNRNKLQVQYCDQRWDLKDYISYGSDGGVLNDIYGGILIGYANVLHWYFTHVY